VVLLVLRLAVNRAVRDLYSVDVRSLSGLVQAVLRALVSVPRVDSLITRALQVLRRDVRCIRRAVRRRVDLRVRRVQGWGVVLDFLRVLALGLGLERVVPVD
jgi:hypothetical protein